MQKIELKNALPRVFAGQSGIRSDVWLQPVAFERGKKYLVSAESGGGLSVALWCDVRRGGIAYLPQELRLFPELTAYENVELKNRLTGYKKRSEILSMFERLGIAGKVDSPVAKMSIGQQQRVAVIRTLCQPCDFFLLDEPVSHLDAANNAIVAAMVEEEAGRTGAGVIATSVGNDLNIKAEEVLRL